MWPIAASALAYVVACGGGGGPRSDERSDHAAAIPAASTQQCPDQVVEGLDVYSGDGAIDWAKVKASGRQFAFIKATQGDYDVQSTFAADWSGALAAGVMRSPYHFFDGTIDGSAQAASFLAELDKVGGLAPGDLPPLLDLECPTSSKESETESGCEYTGDSGWVPTATLSARVFDWLHAVEAGTHRVPIIYSYPAWFEDADLADPELAAYPLFIASYETCATVPAPWTAATFWQYSATSTVPGVAGASDVDVDRFVGTPAQLTGLTTPDAGVPDASAADATPAPDAAKSPETGPGGGCGCHVISGGGDLAFGLVLAFALAGLARRGRIRSRS
jgi:GH25 family lysozyme M1 (1,4-beta-N-acetylmuramidase)